MTGEQFCQRALSLPGAVESAHQNHPDFRVKGKIFATLGPNEDRASLRLTAEQQRTLVDTAPETFAPASGAWGRQGYTMVELARADEQLVDQALVQAWSNITTPATSSKSPARRAPRRRSSGNRGPNSDTST